MLPKSCCRCLYSNHQFHEMDQWHNSLCEMNKSVQGLRLRSRLLVNFSWMMPFSSILYGFWNWSFLQLHIKTFEAFLTLNCNLFIVENKKWFIFSSKTFFVWWLKFDKNKNIDFLICSLKTAGFLTLLIAKKSSCRLIHLLGLRNVSFTCINFFCIYRQLYNQF